MMKNLLSLLFFLISGVLFAQDYNMQNGTITTCSGNFYDSGGPAGNYANGQDFTMIIEPATAGQGIRLTFSSFHLESATWDYLKIYDGPDTSASSPLIGTFGGTISPGIIETGFANTSGKMTLVFHSDSSVTHPGWAATIECFTPVYQEQYIMYDGGAATTCSGVFYDAGGPNGNYANNSNMTYTINPGTAGQSVQVNFLSFSLETSFDRLYIYDGQDVNATLLSILSGTYTTLPVITASAANTSGSLTFKLISDGIINNSGWKANISCVTPPTPPSDVYLMQDAVTIDACAGTFYDPFGEFGYYNDNMTRTMTFCSSEPNQAVRFIFESFNLASGDVLSIYDGASVAEPLIGDFTGTTLPENIEASYANASGCLTFKFTSNSTTIRQGWKATMECFIPTIDVQNDILACAILEVNEGETVGCAGGPCTELNAEVGLVLIHGGADTTEYSIGLMECDIEVQPGTPSYLTDDDIWSGVISLPFSFSFFGNTYSQLLIGANGLVTFDTSLAGQTCPWNFNVTAPNPNLPRNAIFGAYQDIDPEHLPNPNYITYYVIGTAPYRQFVVSYNAVPLYSSPCNSLLYTSRIVLFETSNIIEVYLVDKPTCPSWNNGNALLGIQNAAGTVAFVPEGRNTGAWSATNEKYRFYPNSNLNVEYTFEWLNASNVVISNAEDFTVCPDETTTYTARLTYDHFGTPTVITDTVTVTYEGVSSVRANQPEALKTCLKYGAAVFDLSIAYPEIVGNQTNVTVSYFVSEENANTNTQPLTDEQIHFFAVSENYVVWVRVDSNVDDCYALTSLELIIVPEDEYPVTQPADYVLCASALNSSVATFDLTSLDDIIKSGISVNTVTYYLTQLDAESGTDAIVNANAYQNTSDPQTIYARLENPFGCFNTTSFDLVVNELPNVSQELLSQVVCESNNGNGVFSLPTLGNYDTLYYINQSDAEQGNTNNITNVSSYNSASTTLYVNLSNSTTNCKTVFPYVLTVNPKPTVNAIVRDIESCNYGSNMGIYDIKALETEVNNSSSVSFSYYATQQDAESGTNPINENLSTYNTPARTLYVRLVNLQGCYNTTSYNLTVKNCIPVMPNAFSPNADGVNDNYTVFGVKDVYKDFTFDVYNRWGNKVHSADNSNIDWASERGKCILWDGRVDGIISSNPEATTYYYILDFNSGDLEPKIGWIYVNP